MLAHCPQCSALTKSPRHDDSSLNTSNALKQKLIVRASQGFHDSCRGWGRLGPLAVGLIVPLLMWLEGSVSSMCINPARAFGPALIAGVWDNHWVFWTAPFLGGIPAGLMYKHLFNEKCASCTSALQCLLNGPRPDNASPMQLNYSAQ